MLRAGRSVLIARNDTTGIAEPDYGHGEVTQVVSLRQTLWRLVLHRRHKMGTVLD